MTHTYTHFVSFLYLHSALLLFPIDLYVCLLCKGLHGTVHALARPCTKPQNCNPIMHHGNSAFLCHNEISCFLWKDFLAFTSVLYSLICETQIHFPPFKPYCITGLILYSHNRLGFSLLAQRVQFSSLSVKTRFTQLCLTKKFTTTSMLYYRYPVYALHTVTVNYHWHEG